MRYWWHLILGVVVILLTGCSLGETPVSEEPSELVKLPYEKGTVIDDAFLEKLSFYVPTEADTRCVAVIKCDGSQVTFQEYIVKNGDTVAIEATANEQLIISQYANRTISYSWQVEPLESLSCAALTDSTWMRMPLPEADKDKDGANLDRQNFYFKALKAGTETLKMRYKHLNENRGEVIEMSLKLTIVQ